MQNKVAVTGASGHIGNVLCRLLIEQNWEVKALYQNYSASLEGLPLELVKGNILNKPDLLHLMKDCDIVINCAALISIDGDPTGMVFKTNTVGAKNVLEAAAIAGVKRIIHISSCHAVKEIPHNIAFDEWRPYKTAVDHAYDYSKAKGEQIMLETRLANKPEIVVLRPASIIGPFDYKHSDMGKALDDFYHKKIAMLPPGGYNFVDVRDVAISIIAAISKARSNQVYLLTGHYVSIKELAAAVEAVTKVKTTKKVMPYWLLKAMLPLILLHAKIYHAAPLYTLESIETLRNGHPNMDHSKATKELGHQCRPLKESLEDYFAWRKQTI